MTLQNRCDPWGRLHAVPARGTLMGNRGILHDGDRRITRHHGGDLWIHCLLCFKDRRRVPMSPGTYTELFFLDEVTALAAGHRPCGECQRARYTAFVAAWQSVLGGPRDGRSMSKTMDRLLHPARVKRREKVTHMADAGDLPDGTMVDVGGAAVALWQGRAWRWSFDGYTPTDLPRDQVTVLTPAPIVAVLRAGYVPMASIPA